MRRVLAHGKGTYRLSLTRERASLQTRRRYLYFPQVKGSQIDGGGIGLGIKCARWINCLVRLLYGNGSANTEERCTSCCMKWTTVYSAPSRMTQLRKMRSDPYSQQSYYTLCLEYKSAGYFSSRIKSRIERSQSSLVRVCGERDAKKRNALGWRKSALLFWF